MADKRQSFNGPAQVGISAILECRLFWTVAVMVFLSVLAVQAMVVLPPQLQWRETAFTQLRASSVPSLTPLLSGPSDTPAAPMQGQLDSLVGQGNIVGITLLDAAGQPIAQAGEPSRMVRLAEATPHAHYHDRVLGRYEFTQPAEAVQGASLIVIRLSADSLTSAFRDRIIRAITLVTLFAALLTVVLMAILGAMIFYPVLTVTRALTVAAGNPERSAKFLTGFRRADEMGELAEAADTLLLYLGKEYRDEMAGLFDRARHSAMGILAYDENKEIAFYNNAALRQCACGSAAELVERGVPKITLTTHGKAIDFSTWTATRGYSRGYLQTQDGPKACLFSTHTARRPNGSLQRLYVSFLVLQLQMEDAEAAANLRVETLESHVTGLKASLSQCLTLLDLQRPRKGSLPDPETLDLSPFAADLNNLQRALPWVGDQALNTAPLPPVLARPEDMALLAEQTLLALFSHLPEPKTHIHWRGETLGQRVRLEAAVALYDDIPEGQQSAPPTQEEDLKTRKALALAICQQIVSRNSGQIISSTWGAKKGRLVYDLPAGEKKKDG